MPTMCAPFYKQRPPPTPVLTSTDGINPQAYALAMSQSSSTHIAINGQISTNIGVFSLANPSAPTFVRNVAATGQGAQCDCFGDIVVTGNNPCYAYSISTGALLATINAEMTYVRVDANYIYGAGINTNTFFIYTHAGVLVGSVNYAASGTTCVSMYMSGNYAYLSCQASNTLVAINISVPATPVVVWTLAGFGNACCYQYNGYLFVNQTSSMNVYLLNGDISPTLVNTQGGILNPGGNNVQPGYGKYWVCSTTNGFAIYDVSIPTAISLVVNYNPLPNTGLPYCLFIWGNYIYAPGYIYPQASSPLYTYLLT